MNLNKKRAEFESKKAQLLVNVFDLLDELCLLKFLRLSEKYAYPDEEVEKKLMKLRQRHRALTEDIIEKDLNEVSSKLYENLQKNYS